MPDPRRNAPKPPDAARACHICDRRGYVGGDKDALCLLCGGAGSRALTYLERACCDGLGLHPDDVDPGVYDLAREIDDHAPVDFVASGAFREVLCWADTSEKRAAAMVVLDQSGGSISALCTLAGVTWV